MDGVTGNNEWLDNLKSLAEELTSIPLGSALHYELIQTLEEWQVSRAEVDNTYTILLSFFLGTLKEKGISTDVAQLTAQMIQARAPTLRFTHPFIAPSCGGENSLQSGATAEGGNPNTIIESLRNRIMASNSINLSASSTEQSSENSPEVEPSLHEEQNSHSTCEASDETQSAETFEGEDASQETFSMLDTLTQPEAEKKVDSAYRMHLDRKHSEIDKLQEVLSQKSKEAITQNKEFGDLLEIERSALQQASSITEVELLKEILIGGTDELIEGQRELAEKLKSSFEYLEMVKLDSKQLHEELHKVRLLSLTDEFTGLPNRRAFMRRLEDEIVRAERYDTPLTLALIDLDNFKAINDEYGHPAGDEVLKWYARNALSTFRHCDMVSRYGGEEFAVLFPNTTCDGALKAFKKMRRRIEYAKCESHGHTIKVPSFSAGLTVYHDSDTQESLIKRTDEALYMAKDNGRDRFEVIILDDDSSANVSN